MSTDKITTLKNNTAPVAYAVLIIAIVAAVFLAVSTAVNTISVDSVPVELQSAVVFAQTILNIPLVVFVLIFVRGVFGFYRAKIKFGNDVKYNVNKFGETVALFMMVGIGSFAALPAPYNSAAVGLAFILDVIKTEWSYYKTAT